MDKRGDFSSNVLSDEAVYYVLFVLVFVGLFYYVAGYQQGAAYWEDFYVKELARMVNTAQPGTEFHIDVTRGTEIAKKTGNLDFDSLFRFDNPSKTIIVSLRYGRATRFSYFANVTIVNPHLEKISGGAETNRLYFTVQ